MVLHEVSCGLRSGSVPRPWDGMKPGTMFRAPRALRGQPECPAQRQQHAQPGSTERRSGVGHAIHTTSKGSAVRARKSVLLASPVCTVLLLGMAGCTPATPSGTTASAVFDDQATAAVIGIDRGRRGLTLKSPDGQVTQVYVTDAVRNFDRIAVGDTVRVTVHSRLQVTAAGSVALPGVIVDQAAGRAPRGAKPAGIWAART